MGIVGSKAGLALRRFVDRHLHEHDRQLTRPVDDLPDVSTDHAQQDRVDARFHATMDPENQAYKTRSRRKRALTPDLFPARSLGTTHPSA
jgi:hypothetical protein